MNEHTDLSSTGAPAPAPAPADRLSIENLLPGENPADKQELTMRLVGELAPKTAYQERLAEQLVEYEWEILRHRKLRDASVLEKYRQYATNLLVKGSANFHARGDDIDEDQLLLMRDLVSSDPKERADAEEDFLIKTSWHPAHVLAMAAGTSHAAEAHEARIRDLELRRRQLRKEFEELRAIPRTGIEDAEILPDAP